MAPQYILNGDGAQIDRSKAVINGVTYPIRAISGFSISKNPFSTEKTIGAALVLIGLAVMPPGTFFAISGGVALFILGIIVIVKGRDEYVLNLVTNAGDRRALQTKDKQFIFAIREALNEAIASPQ